MGRKFPSTSVMGIRVHWQHVHCYDDRGRPLCHTGATAGGPCHGQLWKRMLITPELEVVGSCVYSLEDEERYSIKFSPYVINVYIYKSLLS